MIVLFKIKILVERLFIVCRKITRKSLSLFLGPFVIRKTIKNKKRLGPLISVITPYYNQGATVLKTVESILCQTLRNFEYIIVDDGSMPESAKVIDKIKDPRVRIIHQKNKGKGSPANERNRRIRASKENIFYARITMTI